MSGRNGTPKARRFTGTPERTDSSVRSSNPDVTNLTIQHQTVAWTAVCMRNAMTKWCPNRLFLAVVLLMASIAVSAQRGWHSSTLEVGAGPSAVTIFDNDSRSHWAPKLSGAASLGLAYAVKRNLSFTAHAMLERKGSNLTEIPEDVESPEQNINITTSYISFIPGIRQYLGDSGFFIEGGPFVAFLLSSKATQDSYGRGGPFASVDAGISGSIGANPFRSSLKGWHFRLVNNLGLIDANHRTGRKETTNSLSLIVGMRMRTR